MSNPIIKDALVAGADSTGLCTVRDLVALMKEAKQTECELAFEQDGEKVNVMVSLISPIRMVLPPTNDAGVERSRCNLLVAALMKIRQSIPCTDGNGNFIIEHEPEPGVHGGGIEQIDPVQVIAYIDVVSGAALGEHMAKEKA